MSDGEKSPNPLPPLTRQGVVKFHTDLISLACLALTTVFSYTNRVLVHFPEKMTDGVTEQKNASEWLTGFDSAFRYDFSLTKMSLRLFFFLNS
ncbi:TPA: hypothetical protein ACWMKB_005240 [Klebsiella pneumoniae]|uniref:hypothetical protein n=1 Tax=Enterobacterales TaxID=91347 RepID=UPI00114F36B6|nr:MULTISPECIES: hypothetical protein [Enterobacteriaceae]EFH4146412.1 hypothetical protein [Escherichia coli]EGR6985879.1 hypothetical protein [Salmonella enterica subsp. enterica serovar Rissen]MEB2378322.1 hypothetical protein [Citrobacter freundii]HAX4199001.1 hypothetical protein [Escherichia coli]HAX4221621.1 hypothetical protein [Escherichia coli]